MYDQDNKGVAEGKDVQDAIGDSVMIGNVSYDSEMVDLLYVLGVSTKNFKRENKAARRRLVSEIYLPPE